MKKLFCISLLFFSNVSLAGVFNSTSGKCSPIINGDNSGNITIQCNDKLGKVVYSVGVSNIKGNKENGHPLQYEKRVVNDTIEIVPLIYTDPLSDIVFYEDHGNTAYVIYPELDLKISNNTNNTIVIDGGFIEVFESENVSLPRLELSTGYCGNVEAEIFNFGNKDVSNVRFYYNVEVNDEKGTLKYKSFQLNDDFKYKRTFKHIGYDPESTTAVTVNIDNELEEMGVNFNGVTIKQRLSTEYHCHDDEPETGTLCAADFVDLGKFGTRKGSSDFEYNDALLYGYLEYEEYDLFSRKKVTHKQKVSAVVEFFPGTGCGASLDITSKYSYELRNRGKNYRIPMNDISNFIKQGEADRISIRLSNPDPTYHEFKIHLHTLEYGYLPSQRIKLFIPAFH